MADSKIINNAVRILKLVQAGTPADQALRETLTQDRRSRCTTWCIARF